MPLKYLVDKNGRPLYHIWPGVQKFQDVQDIFDRNRVLIAEVNLNHHAGSSEALERNVPMLRELNSNIAKVIELYREAAECFVEALSVDSAQQE